MPFSLKIAVSKAKETSFHLTQLSSEEKQQVLLHLADLITQNAEELLLANAKDLAFANEQNLSEPMRDRLLLNKDRLASISDAVRQIALQPDPVGQISEFETMESGIKVGKMRIPLGVVAMIYESRPNVTIDAASLCFKAGNSVVLRGGKEALHSNLALAACFHDALKAFNIDPAAVTLIPDPDREIMAELLTLSDDIDLLIPRGGESLIRYVSQNSRIPVIQHYKGVCHLYVDCDAKLDLALDLFENGKTQRTGVCNSLETLLVHRDIADTYLTKVAQLCEKYMVKIHACPRAISFFKHALPALEDDWHAEYLAMEIAIKVVDDLSEAITHIQTYSSGHTEVIATENKATQQQFLQQVNSAVVMINASSRFSDGGQLGLGAEIGISTSKLHAYGPMGAESLTTQKFVVFGEGQVRQ